MDLEHLAQPHATPTPQPRRESRWRAGVVLAVIVAPILAGCGMKPFVDGRREAGQVAPVGPSTPDRVAICYSSQGSTSREVLALAQAECAKTNRSAQFDGQDEFRCALLAPTRAFFKCVVK